MQHLYKKKGNCVTYSYQKAKTVSVVVHHMQVLSHPVDEQNRKKQMEHENVVGSTEIKEAGDIQVLLFVTKETEVNYQACCIVWYQLVR